mmetsp:Transcript_15659/g.22286  ORF Transcript_15659/g.22286 Transcript_15659/m.22286 type:complete len:124 (+) Transcript_15659:365-736(+)
MKSRMDINAKKLIPTGTNGGINLMEKLTKACQPTLSDMGVLNLTNQLTNLHCYASETPQEFYFRLQQLQQMSAHQNMHVSISPLASLRTKLLPRHQKNIRKTLPKLCKPIQPNSLSLGGEQPY